MEWKPASRGYAILNAPQTPFLLWGRRKGSRVSTLYLDMWAVVRLLISELKYDGPDQTSEIKRRFEQREEVAGKVRVHAKNSDKWFFPAGEVNLFVGFLPDGIRPVGAKYGQFMREFGKICKQEMKYEGVTEYGQDEDAEVAHLDAGAPEPPVVVRVSKRLREKAARTEAIAVAPTAVSDASSSGEKDQNGDKGKEEMEPEEFAGYALRPKKARPAHPDIVARMNAEYGVPSTVYANSQEELEADAGRLVHMALDDEDDQDIFVNDEEYLPPHEEQQQQAGGMEEEDIYPSPHHSEDYDFAIADQEEEEEEVAAFHEGEGVHTVSLSLSDVEQRIRIDTAAIETLLLVAGYAHDHHGYHRRAADNPFAKTLEDIEAHLVQAARRVMELAPPGANKTTVSVVTVEDADGTEVRMHEMAAAVGMDWSAISSDDQRQLARHVRDEHKRVYGVYPKKKRMMYGGGKAGMIYFYNQETADACMRPVLERYIAKHTAGK